MNIDEIILEIEETRNIKKETKKVYRYALKQYEQTNNKTIEELITEAETEEENHIRMRNRKIKQRLLHFKETMQKTKSTRTVNILLTSIKFIYSFYEIEVPQIKHVQITSTEKYTDIPTKQNIKDAVNCTSNLKAKAIILFMATSGCGRNETSKFTIQDFITATKEYHHQKDIHDVVYLLYNKPYVIPTWQPVRQKVNVNYITFNTPEATKQICVMLKDRLKRKEVELSDPLFGLAASSINQLYTRINDKLMLGRQNYFRFFRSHAMRKFFATTLLKAGISQINIDFMLGHTVDSVTGAYFKADPDNLKNIYRSVVNKLSFFNQYTVHDLKSDERQEYELLKEKYDEYDVRMKQLENLLNSRL